jgi:hypothetical protein
VLMSHPHLSSMASFFVLYLCSFVNMAWHHSSPDRQHCQAVARPSCLRSRMNIAEGEG